MKTYSKYLSLVALIVSLLVLPACKKDKNAPSDPQRVPAPHWQQMALDTITDPHWEMAEIDDEPSSMTVYSQSYPLNDFEMGDQFAAITLQGECLGKCYMETSFVAYAYLQKPQLDQKLFRLYYYSCKTRQCYISDTIYCFENDKQLGTVGNPLNIRWIEAGNMPYMCQVWIPIYGNVKDLSNNELAVFVGDECRAVWNPKKDITEFYDNAHLLVAYLNVPMRNLQEEAQVRFYNANTSRLFVAPLSLDVTQEINACFVEVN